LSGVVLDASAVVAVLIRERGWEVVQSVILDSKMAANNLGEVAQRLLKEGWSRFQIEDAIGALQIEIIPVDGLLALDAAEIREIAQAKGLSQADCICLALAKRMGVAAMTGDQKWLEIAGAVGVEVRVVR
jgi:ribonuclease VapC